MAETSLIHRNHLRPRRDVVLSIVLAAMVAMALSMMLRSVEARAQEETSDPLSLPYQDEETSQGEKASQDEKASGDVDFFDTLDFLGEGEAGASDENIDLETLGGVTISGEPDDDTPGWDIAVFRGLDKVTARVWKFEAMIDRPVMFKQLQINVRRCNRQPPEDAPNTTAFVQVEEVGLNEETSRVFSGWMFASSPGLNAVEHPVYDVWLIDCKMADPSAEPGIKVNVEAAAESESVPAPSSTITAD